MMFQRQSGWWNSFTGLLCSLALAGCGEQPPPPVAAVSPRPESAPAASNAGENVRTASAATNAAAASGPTSSSPAPFTPVDAAPSTATAAPTAAPRTNGAAPAAETSSEPLYTGPAFADEGTVEWKLYEIASLVAPPPTQKSIIGEDQTEQIVDRSPEEILAERKANLRKVISLAGQVIAETHADAGREALFTNAVRYLASAHAELALQGDAEHARKLGEVAEAIFAAKPESAAASEAGYRLVELAQRMADAFGQQNAEWVRACVTQTRLFAERFPQESNRAALSLLEAGRLAEQVGLHDEARGCYVLLKDRFAATPYADEVAAVVRRMNLTRQTLTAADFGGPTIDGGFLTIEQFRGKHVLVVFWASDSPTFQEDIAVLQQLQQEWGENLAIIGVNLDTSEAAVDQFLEAHPLRWRQIFDADPASRGTQNPVARHYAVNTVPLYWLIDPQGVVLTAPADLRRLPVQSP